MPGTTPRSLVVAVVVATAVAAGALAASAALRARASGPSVAVTTTPTSANTPSVGVSGCLVEPCSVLGTATVGGTLIELVADKGAVSGRLRVGGPNSGQVIETTITDMGVKLTTDSLQCLAGGPSACLIRGERDGEVDGQIVVGRSDSWSSLEKPFVSEAGYLVLANIDAGASPEVLAAQHGCQAGDPGSCTATWVHLQAFALTGTVIGCTGSYRKPQDIPAHVTAAQLRQCH
jgi:hypothetical protein